MSVLVLKFDIHSRSTLVLESVALASVQSDLHPETQAQVLKSFFLLQQRYEEGYGTVLDSGTTFTYLPTEAFQAFKLAVSSFALSKGLKATKGPDPKFNDICFGGAPHVEHADQLEHVFPHLELQLQGVRF